MIVDMWMTRDPVTVAPTTSISAAALLMMHQRVRRLVVVDTAYRGGRSGCAGRRDLEIAPSGARDRAPSGVRRRALTPGED